MGECWKSWLGQSMAVMLLTMPSRVRWRDKQGMALPLSSSWSGALPTWVLFLDLAHRWEASSHGSSVTVTARSYAVLAVCASHVAGLAQAQQLWSGEDTEGEGQLPAETPFAVICSLSWWLLQPVTSLHAPTPTLQPVLENPPCSASGS